MASRMRNSMARRPPGSAGTPKTSCGAVVWKIAQEEPPLLEKQVLAIISAEYPALAQSYAQEPTPDPGTA
jgi:hypothetical protein